MAEITDAHAWLGIELRHLAALLTVFDEQSFVRAGRRLGYTQSAISNQVAALERLVGARLIERTRGGSSISLTPVGERLYAHAADLLGRLQAARADVLDRSARRPDALRVGYCSGIGPALGAPLAAGFAARVPGAYLELVPGRSDTLVEDVLAERLDAALVAAPPAEPGLESAHVADDGFVLLEPPDAHGRAPGDDGRPLFACAPCAAQREHEDALAPAGGIVRLDDAETIQALAAAGCGYGLVPALALTRPGLHARPLEGAAREIRLVLGRRAGRRELLAALAACAAEPARTAA